MLPVEVRIENYEETQGLRWRWMIMVGGCQIDRVGGHMTASDAWNTGIRRLNGELTNTLEGMGLPK